MHQCKAFLKSSYLALSFCSRRNRLVFERVELLWFWGLIWNVIPCVLHTYIIKVSLNKVTKCWILFLSSRFIEILRRVGHAKKCFEQYCRRFHVGSLTFDQSISMSYTDRKPFRKNRAKWGGDSLVWIRDGHKSEKYKSGLHFIICLQANVMPGPGRVRINLHYPKTFRIWPIPSSVRRQPEPGASLLWSKKAFGSHPPFDPDISPLPNSPRGGTEGAQMEGEGEGDVADEKVRDRKRTRMEEGRTRPTISCLTISCWQCR